jgi:hypothetical protein
MSASQNKHIRIQAACRELEQALLNFEDDTEIKARAREEAERIREIKKRLEEIKTQLDQLSD